MTLKQRLKYNKKKTEIVTIMIIVAVSCILTTLIGLWAIDISASAMVANKSFEEAGLTGGFLLTNGFRHTEPAQMYHYGMWLVIISNVIFMIVFINIATAYIKIKAEKKIE
jgi:hypothetical protein